VTEPFPKVQLSQDRMPVEPCPKVRLSQDRMAIESFGRSISLVKAHH
jgi:hypothetical protein